MSTPKGLSSQKLVAFAATRDFERAKQFYGGVLGLRLLSEDKFALVFDANGTTLRISAVRELALAPYTVLGWEVADIGAFVDELGKAGVRFEKYGFPGQDERGIWTAPGGAQVAWFKDPEGNILSLSHHPAGAS